PGMATNLTAKVEDQYAHGRYAQVSDKADAPIEDALALLVREKLTGLKPPASAAPLVDLWRPLFEEKAGDAIARMTQLAEDQSAFGRNLRDVLKALELSEELSDGEAEDGDSDENAEGGDSESQENQDNADAEDQESDEQQAEGEEGETTDSSETGETDE